ncbi:MAG TPA: hypothetical protein VGX96_01685, partial [Candidatus Elarobacter sp.]|nr:hypothetical protein [Candidatus Elarobacter sp.]
EVAHASKEFVLETALAAELNVLALRLDRIAQRDPHTRDFTLGALRRALVATIAAFPIYRTYVTGAAVDPADRRFIELAVDAARARDAWDEGSVYAFLGRVLLTEHSDDSVRERYVDFAMRFQQLTAPVMAKGVEDTTFYRSQRLLPLNEVGGDPARFGTSVDEFHRQNARRAASRPRSMVTTATHDMKRGEDVRARLAALSEMPHEWRRALARWARLNGDHRGIVTLLDEYGIYQTLMGAWPIELLAAELDSAALAGFTERVAAYALKAAREAKLSTSWMKPDADYESALAEFVRAILDPNRSSTFLESLRSAARALAATGLTNSLAQVVLRATAPGIPDTYQGTELWDLSLVDPDNRRPVDFAAREAALRTLDDALASGTPREALARDLLAAWPDGRIKLFLLATLLRARAAAPWPEDQYTALAAEGEKAQHVVAFTRGSALVIVPRLPRTLSAEKPPLGEVWGDTAVELPRNGDGETGYRDLFTGRVVTATYRDGRRVLSLAETFAVLPVAVLEPEPDANAAR